MKRFIVLTAGVLFCLASAVAAALPDDGVPGNSRVIPLVVHVNDQGQVTDADPAYKVRPALMRTIRQTLDKIITAPAMKDGKAVSCQFVITLALVTVPQDNGKSSVDIKYVAGKPLPSGVWSWVHTNDHRLALINQSSSMINLSEFRTPNEQAGNARNQVAAIAHEQFMNQVNHGR
jgi:hypothetical protein